MRILTHNNRPITVKQVLTMLDKPTCSSFARGYILAARERDVAMLFQKITGRRWSRRPKGIEAEEVLFQFNLGRTIGAEAPEYD